MCGICTTGNYPSTNFDKCERASLISRCRDLHDDNASHLNGDFSTVIGLIRQIVSMCESGEGDLSIPRDRDQQVEIA